MTTLQLNIFITCIAVPCIILFNSCYEWLVHGPLMHGRLGKVIGLRQGHEDHHQWFGSSEGYANQNHGDSVALPLWAAVVTLGFAAMLGFFLCILTGYWILMWCMIIVSTCYYIFYQYVHTCMHIPKGRWLERTHWFKKKNAYHKVHHFRDENFEQLRNS